jgi:hypothetical protein
MASLAAHRLRPLSDYPAHLQAYEELDSELLPIAAQLGEFTFDQLVAHVMAPKARALAPRWLASTSWRQLIKRCDHSMSSPRTYVLTEAGRHLLRTLRG